MGQSKLARISVLLLLLVACSRGSGAERVLTVEQVGATFRRAPGALEDLKRMVREDGGKRECFAVGTDNVGTHWREQH